MKVFPATLSHLEQMIGYICDQAKNEGMEEKKVYRMELACEEALVNIISYAYSNSTNPGTLSVDCETVGQRFQVTIRDRGRSFNPFECELHPQTDLPIQERRIGGLGIFLIRKVIEEASYQRQGDENVLRLSF